MAYTAPHDYTPPSSPYPGRRAPLPPKLEAELRIACVNVLKNPRPSHTYVDEPLKAFKAHASADAPPAKAQLSYAAIKKSLDKPIDTSALLAHAPTRSSDSDSFKTADGYIDGDSNRYAYKPEALTTDLFPEHDPVLANTMRRRDELLAADPLHIRTKSGSISQAVSTKPSTIAAAPQDRSKYPLRSDSHSNPVGTNGSTPQTDVTEYPWSTSTAPTSAGVTPARTSKRASVHLQSDSEFNGKADGNPIDWIRNEMDKRKAQHTRRRPSEIEKPGMHGHSRAPSKARSIRSMKSMTSIKSFASSMADNVREYIRPNSSRNHSRAGSRSASRADRRAARDAATELERIERGPISRPPPRRDWRNWGRNNKDEANTTVSRSGSTRGRSETRKAASSKSEINLNRELPPLPSLDQWAGQEAGKPTHIANVRSPSVRSPVSISTDKFGRPQPNLVKKSSTVNEKDEIVAARLGSPAKIKPEVYQPTRPRKPVPATVRAIPSSVAGIAQSTDLDDTMSSDARLRIEFTIEDLMPLSSSNTATPAHSYSRSMSSEQQLEARLRLQASPVTHGIFGSHSRSGSSISRSLSFKKARSQASHSHSSSDVSKTSSSNLPSSVPSFSQHRNYDKSHIPPALNSNMANQGRKVANKEAELAALQYQRAADIKSMSPPPPVPPKDESKKGWWQLKAKQQGEQKKKAMTWMDQLEKMGIKDGVLVNDEVAGSPVVRY